MEGRSQHGAWYDRDQRPPIAGRHGGVRARQGDTGAMVGPSQRGDDCYPYADSSLRQAQGHRDELSRNPEHTIRDRNVRHTHPPTEATRPHAVAQLLVNCPVDFARHSGRELALRSTDEGGYRKDPHAFAVSPRIDALPTHSQLARVSVAPIDRKPREHAHGATRVPLNLRCHLPYQMRGHLSAAGAIRNVLT